MSGFAEHTSPTLLARVKANQVGAWERLVELYAPLVGHWCRRASLVQEDAADVFQEVFRAVTLHLPEFRRDRPGDTFRGWLRTITQNKIRDLHRRQARQFPATGGSDAQLRLQALVDPVNIVEDETEVSLVVQRLRQTLDLLRPEFEQRTWQAFWLVQMEGQETADVAAQLGMNAASVRKAKFRVLRRLREELDDWMD